MSGILSTVLGGLSNIAIILLLIAFFRKAPGESRAAVPISQVLRYVTVLAVIAWGLWLAMNVFRLVAAPFAYVSLHRVALHFGAKPPQLANMLEEIIRTVLSQACLFAPPYIVYKSYKRRLLDLPED